MRAADTIFTTLALLLAFATLPKVFAMFARYYELQTRTDATWHVPRTTHAPPPPHPCDALLSAAHPRSYIPSHVVEMYGGDWRAAIRDYRANPGHSFAVCWGGAGG